MPPQVRLLLLVLFSLFPALPSSASFAAPRILCLGDSLTEGLGVAADKAWPALVEKSLHENGFKDAVVINAGVSGATSASGPGRLKWHLKGAAKPDLVILELGANDGLRGQDVKAMRRNLEESIHLAKAAGVPVLLAGMRVPSSMGIDYSAGFFRTFEDLAKAESLPLILFLLDGVAGDAKLNQADGIHPNVEGHKIVAATVLKNLTPLLKK